MILLVLFSACANLGNMVLARGLARQRGITIRLAIGAGRARLLRQLMTENLLLACLGSVAGLAFGAASARLLLYSLDAPPNIHPSVGWPLLITGFALTLVSVIAFGLPSAFQTIRLTHRAIHVRQSLVGVRVAVSCLLLIASGILAHNGILNASLDLRFDYQDMIVVYPQLYARNLPPGVARIELDALSTRLSALPGAVGITAAVAPPLGGRLMIDSLPGLPHIDRNAVAASYFNLMNQVKRSRKLHKK